MVQRLLFYFFLYFSRVNFSITYLLIKKKIPPKTYKKTKVTNINKSNMDLSVFIFRKVKAKAIAGNNNIAFGISAVFDFFIFVSFLFSS